MSDKRLKTGKTNWAKVRATTDEEIDRQIAENPDAAPELDESWFAEARLVDLRKKPITIRLDPEVLEYFQATGKGYQTKINNVLKAFVRHQRKVG